MADLTREAVAAAARDWVGTPFVHGASRKGAGADCLGLVRGVWRELLGAEPERAPLYAPDWAARSREERLMAAAARHFRAKPAALAEVGDLLLFRLRAGRPATHLGVRAEAASGPTVIHAWEGRGVVESPLSASWRRRIAGVFAFPKKV